MPVPDICLARGANSSQMALGGSEFIGGGPGLASSKVCTHCGINKPTTSFYARKGGKTRATCRECCVKLAKERRKSHPEVAEAILFKQRLKRKKATKLKQEEREKLKIIKKEELLRNPPSTKKCCACGRVKSIEDFGKHLKGLKCRCIPCQRHYARHYYKNNQDKIKNINKKSYTRRYFENPDLIMKRRTEILKKYNGKEETKFNKACWYMYNKTKCRASFIKRKYGITLDDYKTMLNAQGDVCKICGQPNSEKKPLFIDHDHKTGCVRGILCATCNAGLGCFKDNPELFQKAISYLTKV